MYIPPNSLVINGHDYTSNATYNSGDCLQSTGITNWWKLLQGNFYSIYIRMTHAADLYGKVIQTYIRTSEVGANGESIVIPLYDPVLRRGYQTGSVFKEFIRTDAHANQANGNRKSLSESVTNAQASGDRTMQLWNFAGNNANSGELDGSGSYDYTFLVREVDGSDNAELKYAAYSSLSASIAESITSDTTIITEIFNEFWTWYDQLSSTEFSGRGFWQQGANNTINYGQSIGNSSATKVIDLDSKILSGDWSTNTLSANTLNTTVLVLSGYTLYLNGDGTVRWQ
jgi:hypothetical protein